MRGTHPELDSPIGPQGMTWRQRAKLAQLRAQPQPEPQPQPQPDSDDAPRLRLVGTHDAPATATKPVKLPPAVPDRAAIRNARLNARATARSARRSIARPAARSAEPQTLAANDPRWVLAIRTAHELDQTTLVPEKRQKLVRLGRSLGLNPFDANLIIAIVQDQARRGTLPEYCASAGHDQLAMVPLPQATTWLDWLRPPRLLNTLIFVACLLGLQALLVAWMLRLD
ncbi:MAG: hypothetical protein AAF823_15800 [Planctomycetota bacterium]